MGFGENNRYMGLDLSTQQLKCLVIDGNLKVVYEHSVRFDDLRHYETKDGCHIHEDGVTVTSPTIMWIEAWDTLLSHMQEAGFDFSKVRSISGAGQLKESFAIPDSPIWMDSSTETQCRQLEDSVGGPMNLAKLTGARGYERLTGAQILKIIQQKPDAYKDTERISLVSSLLPSLLIGSYASIDYSDGSGMNLLNIYTKKWEDQLLKRCADDLGEKLGEPVPTTSILGCVSSYFVERYGFTTDCKVVAFAGDNPAALAGIRMSPGDISLSMGTSDNVICWINKPEPSLEGNIFINPIDKDAYMAIVCFKNGSLTREAIRDKYCGGSWDTFNSMLSETPPGNEGCIGLYYTICEIIPNNVTGCYYYSASDDELGDLSPVQHVRALLEGQFLSRRVHAEQKGLQKGEESKVLVTGGASNNPAIIQMLSDVFGSPVYQLEVCEAAALGGAYLGLHSTHQQDGISFHSRLATAPGYRLAANPDPKCKEIYDVMAARYKMLEEKLVKRLSQ